MNTPFVRLQLDSIAESEFEFYCTRSALGRVYRIVVMYCVGSTHSDYEAYSFVCAVDRRHLGLRSKETRVWYLRLDVLNEIKHLYQTT